MRTPPRQPLRPIAFAVSGLIIVASSLLISAAHLGRPAVSGYGVDPTEIQSTQMVSK